MIDEAEKRKYRNLYSKLTRIAGNINYVNECLQYIKDDLNDNFIIDNVAVGLGTVNQAITDTQAIKNDLYNELIPYASNRRY